MQKRVSASMWPEIPVHAAQGIPGEDFDALAQAEHLACKIKHVKPATRRDRDPQNGRLGIGITVVHGFLRVDRRPSSSGLIGGTSFE
jgi:hypothetical protein